MGPPSGRPRSSTRRRTAKRSACGTSGCPRRPCGARAALFIDPEGLMAAAAAAVQLPELPSVEAAFGAFGTQREVATNLRPLWTSGTAKPAAAGPAPADATTSPTASPTVRVPIARAVTWRVPLPPSRSRRGRAGSGRPPPPRNRPPTGRRPHGCWSPTGSLPAPPASTAKPTVGGQLPTRPRPWRARSSPGCSTRPRYATGCRSPRTTCACRERAGRPWTSRTSPSPPTAEPGLSRCRSSRSARPRGGSASSSAELTLVDGATRAARLSHDPASGECDLRLPATARAARDPRPLDDGYGDNDRSRERGVVAQDDLLALADLLDSDGFNRCGNCSPNSPHHTAPHRSGKPDERGTRPGKRRTRRAKNPARTPPAWSSPARRTPRPRPQRARHPGREVRRRPPGLRPSNRRRNPARRGGRALPRPRPAHRHRSRPPGPPRLRLRLRQPRRPQLGEQDLVQARHGHAPTSVQSPGYEPAAVAGSALPPPPTAPALPLLTAVAPRVFIRAPPGSAIVRRCSECATGRTGPWGRRRHRPARGS